MSGNCIVLEDLVHFQLILLVIPFMKDMLHIDELERSKNKFFIEY